MTRVPRISEAEWEVMRVAWQKGAVTAQEVVEELAHIDWSPRTVKTLMSRLLKKGALVAEARGKAYLYRPAVRLQDCVRQESQSFLDRVFAGAAVPAVVHFVKRAKLTPSEIEELKRILADKEEG
jgi:BlaI family penicillinase repressor